MPPVKRRQPIIGGVFYRKRRTFHGAPFYFPVNAEPPSPNSGGDTSLFNNSGATNRPHKMLGRPKKRQIKFFPTNHLPRHPRRTIKNNRRRLRQRRFQGHRFRFYDGRIGGGQQYRCITDLYRCHRQFLPHEFCPRSHPPPLQQKRD